MVVVAMIVEVLLVECFDSTFYTVDLLIDPW